ILLILVVGVVYRLVLTSGGNFLFNMDNARDMVDVREMIELKKPRLIGPTSAIEGLYNGPAWYFLLAVPYILSDGDPYAAIVMLILFWAVGGWYLLKIVSRWGIMPLIATGALWVSSNYVVLANLYSLNPNPVVLLTPVFIFFLEKYLKTSDLLSSITIWFLAGLFFNLEMAFGFLIPIIIFSSILLSKGKMLKKNLYIGLGVFFIFLLPQILFELRHDFIGIHAILNHINTYEGSYSFSARVITILHLYRDVLTGTFLNKAIIAQILLISAILYLYFWRKEALKNNNYILIAIICLTIIPFVLHIILPFNVNAWHLGGVSTASILAVGWLSGSYAGRSSRFNVLVYSLTSFLIISSIVNLDLMKSLNPNRENNDPSSFRNEIAAIDYVYQQAKGQNFRVYIYLPSVIDYPYQYLFWWYGLKKYGYLPKDYAYLPNQPIYISNKEKLPSKFAETNSNLVFLIKEPDRIKIRHLWENNFSSLNKVSQVQFGSLEIEVRKEN
ncbi:MAG: hypothetical protein US55_C0066G0009, partial [Candidatus Levybacteria bacterium GW2011_GWC2_37_7]